VGGPLASGDVCIASITRNDPGRMGAADASIYLASAATVAASAVAGEIADPRNFTATANQSTTR
jgi:3-isopropylmalate/(R)-2-methylmalate dehydratase large subunit